MNFVLRLYDRGLCGCELVSSVDLLFNRKDEMLCGCGCGLISGCGFIWWIVCFLIGGLQKQSKY